MKEEIKPVKFNRKYKVEKFIPEGITEDALKMITNVKAQKNPTQWDKTELIVFHVGGGGLGKNIQSTAVFESIREKYGEEVDYHVITPYPDVYKGVEGITVFDPRVTKGYLQMIHNTYGENNYTWLQAEPYTHHKYISGKMHVIQAWKDLLGIKVLKNVAIEPMLNITEKERKEAKQLIRSQGKPVILVQFDGGSVKVGRDKNGKEMFSIHKMFERNLPYDIAQQTANELLKKYSIIQVAKRGQPLIQGALHVVDYDIRKIFAIIAEAQIILCIDSFVQHAACALGKKAIVLWGATNPATLGYSCHQNLYRIACPTPSCGRPNSFLMDVEPDGKVWQCPLGAPCCNHDIANILKAVEEY